MPEKIDGWRSEINQLDQELLGVLEKRFKFVEKIGHAKKSLDLPVRDEVREFALIEQQVKQSTLSPDFIRDLYQVIFSYAYIIEQ